MPGLRFDIPFFITITAGVISVIGFGLLALGVKGAIATIVLQVISVFLGVIRVNIGWNNNLRTNICHCYSKSQQAKALWAPETAHERLLQKDIFHEESGIGYKIRVLRDGTVEMHAGDLGDSLHEDISKHVDKLEDIDYAPAYPTSDNV